MSLESPLDVMRLFLSRVAERSREERERRRGELHLTDLTAECMRQVWYEKRDPLPEDPVNMVRMWEGDMLHQMPLLKEHELELELEGAKARIDEYEDGVLVEKKFVSFIPKSQDELSRYYSHYVKQVEYEALFLAANGRRVRRAFLLFVCRGEPEGGRPPVAVFEVPLDMSRIVPRFNQELEAYRAMLSSDTPPEIPRNLNPFDYPCSYCKYRPRCFGA
jgi:CRISPR/Cas system-associated exonuclease Cas4 (RecB family)